MTCIAISSFILERCDHKLYNLHPNKCRTSYLTQSPVATIKRSNRRLRLRLRLRLAVGGHDGGAADGASRMRVQPHVDALHVEQVLARRQPPDHLADLHQPQAYHALRPPRRVPAAATLPLVRKRRDRRHGDSSGPAAAPGSCRTPQRGAPPGLDLEIAEGERDGAGGDAGGPDDAGDEVEQDEGEEDAEGEEHREVVVVAVVRSGSMAGAATWLLLVRVREAREEHSS
jgi:hypothetical protein